MGAALDVMWRFIGHNAYLCSVVCAAATGLAWLLHSGNGMAIFACIASGILMWKTEADHPGPVAMPEEAIGQ